MVCNRYLRCRCLEYLYYFFRGEMSFITVVNRGHLGRLKWFGPGKGHAFCRLAVAMAKGGALRKSICMVADVGYIKTIKQMPHCYLEPQTTIKKWMFGETTISYVKIGNHPIETTIYKWLFGVPGTSHSIQFFLPRRLHSDIHFNPPDRFGTWELNTDVVLEKLTQFQYIVHHISMLMYYNSNSIMHILYM